VTFGYPRINGQPPQLKSASVHHPGPGEMSAAPDCATAVADGSNVVVTLGPEIQRTRKERNHKLNLVMPGQ
jgi:hypothetical protein